MELRIVELAHKRGLTITDIAKMIGISRVNLSNSLNGNPTLSRLREVAQILNVDVSELFKPASNQSVQGYIECDDKIVKVDNLKGLRAFIAEIDTDNCSLSIEKETMVYLMTLKKAFEATYGKAFTLDDFLVQMAASVEEGDCAVWEEFCKMQTEENKKYIL